jgi:hypothetical protein
MDNIITVYILKQIDIGPPENGMSSHCDGPFNLNPSNIYPEYAMRRVLFIPWYAIYL